MVTGQKIVTGNEHDYGQNERRGDQPIDAIEKAAVSGDEIARILDAMMALQCGFEEIAPLLEKAKHGARQRRAPRAR